LQDFAREPPICARFDGFATFDNAQPPVNALARLLPINAAVFTKLASLGEKSATRKMKDLIRRAAFSLG